MKREGILLMLILMVVSQSSLATIIPINPPNEICDNGMDDDNDGLIDCYDPDCCASPLCDDIYFDPCTLICLDTDTPQPLDLKLEWTSLNNNWHPYNTPIVGDLDGDGAIEIIGNKGIWQGSNDYKDLLVINGKEGLGKKVVSTPWFRNNGGDLCIADVDYNGYADIFFKISDSFYNPDSIRNLMTCYEYVDTTYQQKWISKDTAVGTIPSLADFNQDQIPELYTGTHIFNSHSGELLIKGEMESSYGLGFSVAADVLPDDYCNACQGLELVVGNQVYSVWIDPSNPAANQLKLENVVFGERITDGVTSLSDMDGDGDLDAVVSSPDGQLKSTIYIWDIQEADIMASFTFTSNTKGWASLPCIRDIDQDNFPEIAISSTGTLRMLQFDGNILSERWQIKIEDSSSRSGCTIFDLNGDGHFELLHRDQLNFRILNASDGSELFIDPCISTNLYEHPVVVDVDQDGESEILCSCENELRAYGSDGDPWVSSRSIWNQYNYHYSNINDDLTIPSQQQTIQIPGDGKALNQFLNQYANESIFSYVDINLPDMVVLELGQSFLLEPLITAKLPLSFEWSPPINLSCTDCENPSAQPSTDQQYTLVVTDANSCTNKAAILISVLECGKSNFSIPNAFTPDGDSVNDHFEIIFATDLPIEGNITIFNRWGNRVFSSDHLYAKWNGQTNGRLAASEVYLYRINFQCADGRKQTLSGPLTLIR